MRRVFLITLFVIIAALPMAALANQCFLNCPAGDGGAIGPGAGNKSPDMNMDGAVGLPDLALFSAAYPPTGTYDYCADFNCDGLINIVDLGIFAAHWLHAGPVPIPGFCQPGGDHYKSYIATNGPPIVGPITLDDQFGSTTHSTMLMSRVATPTEKNGEPLCDPFAHQTWYEFFMTEPPRSVIARDQFGEREWFLGPSRFLIAPALKNMSAAEPLPNTNHYKCYEAQGPTYGIDVVLRDQFGIETVNVLYGKLFCNPTKKTTPDGITYDIVDPISHLTCYQLVNPIPHQFTVVVRDQFVEVPVILLENDCLCLPAQKLAVGTPGTTEWNRIKALFDSR